MFFDDDDDATAVGVHPMFSGGQVLFGL